MSDIDDEEYESFDLEGAGRSDTDVDLDDDDDDDDEIEDDLEDADEDEIDFVVATYREEGQLMVVALAKDLANDLNRLIMQLRRLPADTGALGMVSLIEEVFVLVRVRGMRVSVLLSDGSFAADWPIARDVADYLDEDIPDEDDEDADEPLGDLNLLADAAITEFDLINLVGNLDLNSPQMLMHLADRLRLNPLYSTVVGSVYRG